MRFWLMAALFILAGCKNADRPESLSERIAADKVEIVPDSDPEMARAYAKARASLDEFLSLMESKRPDLSDFSVKVGVKDGARTEYFWLDELSRTGDDFTGTISNEPQFVEGVKIGQRYAFKRADIVDWMYVSGLGKMHGNFTACAMLTKEPAEQAAQIRAQYGLTCE